MEVNDFPGAQSPVTTLLETRRGALLAGTLNEGLFVLPPGAPPLHFSRTNGLSHDWVHSLCEDHEGNIWIGTGAGLDTLRVRKVKMLNPPDAWQGRAVLSFAARPDGSAWLGTEGAGEVRMREAVEGARGVEEARVRVGDASLDVGAPHEGQKAAPSGSSLTSTATVPASARSAPATIRTNVDLPAPFSPRMP